MLQNVITNMKKYMKAGTTKKPKRGLAPRPPRDRLPELMRQARKGIK